MVGFKTQQLRETTQSIRFWQWREATDTKHALKAMNETKKSMFSS